MSIDNILTNIKVTLDNLADVVPENQEPGNVDYHLGISLGDQSTMYHFGAKKINQGVVLTLSPSGTIPDGEIAEKQKEISDALAADRRRGTYAQTTVIGPWEKQEDEGREGKVFELILEVHFYE